MKPERLERTSVDGSKLNLEALYHIVPSCFTEEKDEKTGAVKHVVNFKILRQLLGDNAVEDSEEMYQFTWPGKQAARREASASITDTLRPVPEDSIDWDTTENLYIEGDNLRVLKLLQKGYMGKVKMIYIDPPYNTGNDFVYHDDFAHTAEEEELAAGNVDEEGNRYRKNLDSNGRFHSDWCSMIYSRLLVARSLLTEDGVIFISIDDNEVRNLKNICDEVFGEKNFVGQWNWFKSATPPNLSKKIKKNIEYVLSYHNGANTDMFCGIKKVSSSDDPSTKPQNSYKVWKFAPKTINCKFRDGVIPKGTYGTEKFPNELLNDLTVKNGTNENEVSFRNRFIWVQETLEDQLNNGTVVNLSKQLVISYKKAEYGAEAPPNLIDSSVGVYTTEYAGNELTEMFGRKVFDYPKPVSLLKYLINFYIKKEEKQYILDFFSGSATTAHAVMQLNAEDKGNRRYICVQLPEETPEDSEARKAGYNTIPDIAKERIRRAGKKIKEESPLTTQDLDTGFRVFRLADSNYENVEKSPDEYDQQMLDLFADNIKADRTDLDLLFGAMLSWGVQLSLPMQTEEVDGCKIYTVDGNGLVACFAENITENVVKAMADKQPLRVLFRDSCFDEDKTKINIFELFKQQLDWDENESMQNIRVI
ncbi:site-specific DNA-methyltransferase [Prevotella sp. OH937_COT-195]|uniref:site-specific DNA-methyltransferase n=1 Tax=Prevotella sp. OH937_COT-195 TaxID=2491051 RepID=UPI000F64B9D8|nr:site-specific DNA-methyltransferase [Prevotella sp. OH937_COT-195]RRD02596.1 site-specific DNA-methyltransferase [Prevotella sp. OH937_COT-195]